MKETLAGLTTLIEKVGVDECCDWQPASFQAVTGMEKGGRKQASEAEQEDPTSQQEFKWWIPTFLFTLYL